MEKAKIKAMQDARAKTSGRKRRFKSGMKVRVTIGPKGAEYLEGKIGTLVYKHSLATVEIEPVS